METTTNVIGCNAKWDVYSVPLKSNGEPIEGSCGRYYGGQKLLCGDCQVRALAKYPQGWQCYPGDTCRHGTYVGGSGADYLCDPCEMGED
jgi:hypothetical protein